MVFFNSANEQFVMSTFDHLSKKIDLNFLPISRTEKFKILFVVANKNHLAIDDPKIPTYLFRSDIAGRISSYGPF